MKTLLILILIGVSSIFTNGQEKKEDTPLRLSFEIKDRNLCYGDSADLITKLTNINKKPVVIDVNQIGSVKYFDRLINKTKKDLYGSVGVKTGLLSHYKPNFVILQSMESYTTNLKFVFNPEFFTKVGKYQMQVGYEQLIETKFENINVWNGVINSNKINIFINKCAK